MLTADSRILVIGTIGVGKSHLIGRIIEQAAGIQAHSIDALRREHEACTEAGEKRARDAFLQACTEQKGIFEFTGGGPLFKDVKRISRSHPFDLIIRVHAPAEVCVERVSARTDWPPYPNEIMPDQNMIDAISDELDGHGFDSLSLDWNGQPLLHVSGVME